MKHSPHPKTPMTDHLLRSLTPTHGTPRPIGDDYTYQSAGVTIKDVVGRGSRTCVHCPNVMWSDVEDQAHHCPGRLALILGVHHGSRPR